MIIFILILLVQVALIVDVVRNRRPTLWIMALLMLPVASTVAYLIVEVLPRYRNHRHVRTAQAEVVRRIDPERDLRAARAQLDMADTVANRIRLGDALSELGRHGEALPLFQKAAGPQPDLRTGEKLARSLYLNDRPVEALKVLDGLERPFGQRDRDEMDLLRARVLEDLGREEEALALYSEISHRMPGDEARCRHAGLLLKVGRKRDARLVLTDVEQRLRQADRHSRAANATMYDWAMAELAKLRA